jgi:hypothetical protein
MKRLGLFLNDLPSKSLSLSLPLSLLFPYRLLRSFVFFAFTQPISNPGANFGFFPRRDRITARLRSGRVAFIIQGGYSGLRITPTESILGHRPKIALLMKLSQILQPVEWKCQALANLRSAKRKSSAATP